MFKNMVEKALKLDKRSTILICRRKLGRLRCYMPDKCNVLKIQSTLNKDKINTLNSEIKLISNLDLINVH